MLKGGEIYCSLDLERSFYFWILKSFLEKVTFKFSLKGRARIFQAETKGEGKGRHSFSLVFIL